MSQKYVRSRAAAVLAALALPSGPVLRLCEPFLAPSRISVETGLSCALAWALLACWCWLVATAAVVAVEAAVTGRATHRLSRTTVGRAVALACGVTVAAGLASPSYADTRVQLPHTVSVLDGLPLPDRVSDRVSGGDAPPPSTSPSTSPSIVVRPGDTLSGLASTHGLSWPALYRANRDVIGDDPDLILPGTRLTLPTHEGAPS